MAFSMNASNARRPSKPSQGFRQNLVVAEVSTLGEDLARFTLKPADNGGLAPFEAGSLLPVFVTIGGSEVRQSYGISSSPRQAEAGEYEILVKRTAGGYVSAFILENWQAGDCIVAGAPRETEVHRHMEDGCEIVALAGGMGVPPFHSMAKALAEGDVDYRLTLFCSADAPDGLLYRDEWRELEAQAEGKLKVVPVIASGEAEGCERGPITCEMVMRHADISEAMLFICGPGPMVAQLRKELAPLNLSRRHLRFSFSGDGEWRRSPSSDAIHQLTVRTGGETHIVAAREDETILTALEKAGLRPPAYCRSSICGFCQSTVTEGSYILATDEDGIRTMDRRHGSIHTCCSYPTSDMELVIPRTGR